MRKLGSYALITTYLVVQLFGQVIHAWSGCEHAHLPGHSRSIDSHSIAAVEHGHSHHHHGRSHDAEQSGPGWHAGQHQHGVVVDGCLLCQHLALGQMATSTTDLAVETIALQSVTVHLEPRVTTRLLGPNSPRAPPLA
ncbi:hypothetical protein GC197_13035 [bacterium]|nr:hypothetical protein [bacterium]